MPRISGGLTENFSQSATTNQPDQTLIQLSTFFVNTNRLILRETRRNLCN